MPPRPPFARLALEHLALVWLALAAALAAGPAAASGAGPAGAPPAVASPVIAVRGCHADVQRHYVPEFRETVPHRHLKGSCRPVPERRALPVRDCHRDVRRHAVPGAGVILHRHVGDDCAIRRVNRSSEPKP